MCVYIYIYIYIFIDNNKLVRGRIRALISEGGGLRGSTYPSIGSGEDTAGNPHRAQTSQFEPFELIPLLKLDEQFPAERFEATVSQSTVNNIKQTNTHTHNKQQTHTTQ